MTANTIDEVIQQLDKIITQSKKENSTIGFFAALYQNVTIVVRDKMGTGYFDDDQRMEKLDVIFANRYLQAYQDYMNGEKVTNAWAVAFKASHNPDLIVLHHLLLGMNAHINLDLGIAAAKISDDSAIENLEHDFNRINEILSSLIEDVQKSLSRIWPLLIYPLKWLKKADDFFINFSMKLARDGAWKFAGQLVHVQNQQGFDQLLSDRDKRVSVLSKRMLKQSRIEKWIFKIIRMTEKGSVNDKTEALERTIIPKTNLP